MELSDEGDGFEAAERPAALSQTAGSERGLSITQALGARLDLADSGRGLRLSFGP